MQISTTATIFLEDDDLDFGGPLDLQGASFKIKSGPFDNLVYGVIDSVQVVPDNTEETK